MRTYLATLHKRPHYHKKRFALAVSGIFTLIIFSVWAAINFAVDKNDLAESREISPFASLMGGAAASFRMLTGNLDEMKTGLEAIKSENAR